MIQTLISSPLIRGCHRGVRGGDVVGNEREARRRETAACLGGPVSAPGACAANVFIWAEGKERVDSRAALAAIIHLSFDAEASLLFSAGAVGARRLAGLVRPGVVGVGYS